MRFEERGEKDEDDIFEEINKGMECDVVKSCLNGNWNVMLSSDVLIVVMLSSDVRMECDVIKSCLNGNWNVMLSSDV